MNEILENSFSNHKFNQESSCNSLDNLTIRCNLVDKIEDEQLFIQKENKIDQISKLLEDPLDFPNVSNILDLKSTESNKSKKLTENLFKTHLSENKETMTSSEFEENEGLLVSLNQLPVENKLTVNNSFCKILFEEITQSAMKKKFNSKHKNQESNHYISNEMNYFDS